MLDRSRKKEGKKKEKSFKASISFLVAYVNCILFWGGKKKLCLQSKAWSSGKIILWYVLIIKALSVQQAWRRSSKPMFFERSISK